MRPHRIVVRFDMCPERTIAYGFAVVERRGERPAEVAIWRGLNGY